MHRDLPVGIPWAQASLPLRKSSAALANASLSFPSPHCLQNGISSRLVRVLPGFQARCSLIALGEGKGQVLSQERILLESFPGGPPLPSLWKRGKGERWGKENHSTSLFSMSPPQVSGFLNRNCRFAFYCLCLKPIPFLLMTPGGAHSSAWKTCQQYKPEDCKTSPWHPRRQVPADRASGFKPRLFLGTRECLEWTQHLSCLPTTHGRTVGPVSVIMDVTLDVWNTRRIPKGETIRTASAVSSLVHLKSTVGGRALTFCSYASLRFSLWYYFWIF